MRVLCGFSKPAQNPHTALTARYGPCHGTDIAHIQVKGHTYAALLLYFDGLEGGKGLQADLFADFNFVDSMKSFIKETRTK